MKCSLVNSNFLEEISSLSHPIVFLWSFLCTDHWGRLSYLSLLFFGTLYSDGYIFPFLLCFSLLFFSQLFVRPPQTAILLFAFLFLGDGFDHCLLYNVSNLHPQFFRHSIRSNPLNLFKGLELIIFCMIQGDQTRTPNSLERWDRVAGGREVQEGGDLCIPMADSCWYMQKPTQHYKAVILQLKINKFFKKLYNHAINLGLLDARTIVLSRGQNMWPNI